MRYLQQAYALAEERGYLQYPEVMALRDRVPAWMLALATESGQGRFERRHGFRVPPAVLELYRCPRLACLLEVIIDGDVFLSGLATLTRTELPPLVTWSERPHVVFASHYHSGMVTAARLGVDDPPVMGGFTGDSTPVVGDHQPPEVFSDWVLGAVDEHEVRLDYWQGVYERGRANPAEAERTGGVEWVRSIPGMPARLDRQGP
jgi:hypothetical protein